MRPVSPAGLGAGGVWWGGHAARAIHPYMAPGHSALQQVSEYRVYTWSMYEVYMEYVWSIYGVCMEYICGICEAFVENTETICSNKSI